jgi:hypothetical protein
MKNPYTGDLMHQCLSVPFDFKNAYAVVVSGATWNPCGHMLVNAGGRGGYYFHVAEVRGYPRYMREAGYLRYLKDEGKKEIRRVHVKLKNPEGAQLKLEQLLAQKWTWFVLPHNCAAFAEEIFQAGGTDAGLYLNCPTAETFR